MHCTAGIQFDCNYYSLFAILLNCTNKTVRKISVDECNFSKHFLESNQVANSYRLTNVKLLLLFYHCYRYFIWMQISGDWRSEKAMNISLWIEIYLRLSLNSLKMPSYIHECCCRFLNSSERQSRYVPMLCSVTNYEIKEQKKGSQFARRPLKHSSITHFLYSWHLLHLFTW